jgi:probable rRNA maturation factor
MNVDLVDKTRTKNDLLFLKKIVLKFLKYFKIKKEVSIVLIGDKKIRFLNKKYRKKDKITDVLSFREEDSGFFKEKDFLGEIFIDCQQIKRQAKKNKNTYKKELIFIMVHGLLHLIGYNDETEKEVKKMIDLGQKFIDLI